MRHAHAIVYDVDCGVCFCFSFLQRAIGFVAIVFVVFLRTQQVRHKHGTAIPNDYTLLYFTLQQHTHHTHNKSNHIRIK